MSIDTLTVEKMQELDAEKQKLVDGVEELKNTSPKSLWLKDLDAFEKELDVLDQMDLAEETQRKKRIMKGKKGGIKGAPKQRKKAAAKKEKSDTEGDYVPEPVVPKRGAQRKKASKKAPVDEVEPDLPELKVRLANISINDCSLDHSAMETETTELQDGKLATKGPSKRGGGNKASSSLAMIPSDDENDDFRLEEVLEVQAPRKGRGRKPAAAAPKAPATRKRAPAQGNARQKKIDEMLKPNEDNNTSALSPENKVRKMRDSPFNKKSGSCAQKKKKKKERRVAHSYIEARLLLLRSETTAEASPPSGSSAEPVFAAQPRRTARATKKPVYVSDSDPEDEVVELTNDSDFDVDGDSNE